MECQQEHIVSIFKEFTTPSRVLQSFTNLSNTVIQTALSGQGKFIFEILQNADDAFEDKDKEIEIEFILHDSYLIVRHNGKGFDYNDVERICDYASQIEEVKATDLSKTGYKGLGFKSLFNLSDCIYICSNGYSFRFDKTYWPDLQYKPWQVIPIWCTYDELPLNNMYSYEQPVNFILKLNNINQLERQLREVINQPELLLFLHRINVLIVDLNKEKCCFERKIEKFGFFNKVNFYKNQDLVSAWLLRTYNQDVPKEVQTAIEGASRFIYPDKIKKAKKVPFTFALQIDEMAEKISKVHGLCFSTLPMQLHLTVPYHINTFFILNLDRTQLHENEWNEYLLYQIGFLQLFLLRDLAGLPNLRNYVIELLVRDINHPYSAFSKAFLQAFTEAKGKIEWLPAHHGSCLLKLGEAWTDETEFFKQCFQNIRNHKIYPFLISYDVRGQHCLFSNEAKHFSFNELFNDFPSRYYPQLTKESYIHFISYLYEKLKKFPFNTKNKLKNTTFLLGKDNLLIAPKNAMLDDCENPIPDFLMLNPIDNDFLPLNDRSLIKDWLVLLGARRLVSPIEIIRESIMKWIDSGSLDLKINLKNHIGIISYLAMGIDHLTKREIEKLKERLLVLTESNNLKLTKHCYLPGAIPIRELEDIILTDELLSSTYNMHSLKKFFIYVGVHEKMNPIDVLRKSIFRWLENGKIGNMITESNYFPIIEYIADHYSSIESGLTNNEIKQLENIPIFTRAQKFQKAQLCYFDSAIPNVKGLEHGISENMIISVRNVSDKVKWFLKKIGVSKTMASVEVIRKVIIRWIREGEINNRITRDNHFSILEYIANNSSGLKQNEKLALREIPILTKSGKFRAANKCYWAPSSSHGEEIPGLEAIISPDEFVSPDYNSKEIIWLLESLGVRNLNFNDIYEKYINHLIKPVNIKWFFTHLNKHWEKHKSQTKSDKLLNYVQHKFTSLPYLLGTDGKKYKSTALYSSQFHAMHSIDPHSVPLLNHTKVPVDLEKWLCFKEELDLPCIMQLLKAVQKNPQLGNTTIIFFTILLEQLRLKKKNEIRMYELSLLSKENKLIPAKQLYYFVEEDSICFLESFYLKRIDGMSHEKTLELAQLCGVNILPFEQKVKIGTQTHDYSLKEFYLDRLSFIVLQESKKRNEKPIDTLKHLYSQICSIEFYLCSNIDIQYPFGIHNARYHIDELKVYVLGDWSDLLMGEIRERLNTNLCFKTDVNLIMGMSSITENNKQRWLQLINENPKQFNLIEEELQKLRFKEIEKANILDPFEFTNVDQSGNSSEEEKYFEQSEVSNSESSDDHSVDMILKNSPYNQQILFPVKSQDIEVYSTVIDERKIEAAASYMPKDVAFISEDGKQEWLLHLKEDPQESTKSELQNLQLKEIEKAIVASLENEKIVQSANLKEDENYFEHCKLTKNKKIISSESSSDEDSIDMVLENNLYLQQIPPATKSEGSGIYGKFMDELKERPFCEATEASISKSNAGPSTKLLVQMKSEIDSEFNLKKRIQDILDGNFSITENFYADFPRIFQESSGEFLLKWVGEKYVFTFLQDHYKNKYPNSQYDLSGGLFTLQGHPSHKIEVIWLNECKETGCSYDLLLKKDGKIKQIIEVQSTNIADNDSFNLSHNDFTKKVAYLATELPQHKEKYCIYCVINVDNSSTTHLKELNNSAALYKIVPLKYPQI